MTTTVPVMIKSRPGIKRDGTQFDGDNYTDGQWVRFQRGLPRKIGGYLASTQRLPEKVYGLGSFSANNQNYIHAGSASLLEQVVVGSNGIVSAINARTPAGFAADANNLWTFDNLPSAVASVTDVLAHGAPNLADIASTVERPIYFAQADLATAFVASGLSNQSGGTIAIGPYAFGYGNSGAIQWSQPNNPAAIKNTVRVTGQKFVAAKEIRGGGGPSALFWSLDALVRATFNSDPTVDFDFDTMAGDLSILSSRSIIDYNGVYYWWDNSGPLMFNGVVREVPNELNINFLLDNLNYTWRQKMFAVKIPRWGEIWWCFPFGSSTECNHAVIYNVREGSWYDTALDGTRTSGVFASVYPKPFMTDAEETATGFTMWQHETGVDKIEGANVEPIPSHFTTADMSIIVAEQATDAALRIDVVEPDFVQVGDMYCTVSGKANARSVDISSEQKTFPQDNGGLAAADQIVRFSENRRELRFTFGSNTPNGDYQMGQVLGHVEKTDGRITQ